MTRINLFPLNSVAWGKSNHAKANSNKNNFDKTSTLIFAALLIACSITVGCSSDKPKPVGSISPAPIAQPTPPIPTTPVTAAAPVEQAAVKHVHKKVVRKVPPTVTYVDSVSGVTFQYPRKYALKTGDAASELVSSGPTPMDFVQPGGIALAAVALPDSTYPNSDLASAFFNVSVNKTLTADQCSEFSVPQPNPAAPADPNVQATAQLATSPLSKLMIGDMELNSAETNAAGNNSSREESSKYYHVFQNGACYEFALKVATTKLDTATTTKPSPSRVDHDEVFHRLEAILATVKINPVTAPDVNAAANTNTQPASP
ncbi:MAG: hypothetical protein WBV55_06965, partial [Candidatus Sulfotelmatobacter sp.]